MAQSRPLCIGMDGHTASIAVASVAQAHGAAGISRGPIGTRQWDLDQLLCKRPSKATALVCGYEAGPGGSWRSRSLPKEGDACGGWRPLGSLKPRVIGAKRAGETPCHWPAWPGKAVFRP
jgi:hypothetical protein